MVKASTKPEDRGGSAPCLGCLNEIILSSPSSGSQPPHTAGSTLRVWQGHGGGSGASRYFATVLHPTGSPIRQIKIRRERYPILRRVQRYFPLFLLPASTASLRFVGDSFFAQNTAHPTTFLDTVRRLVELARMISCEPVSPPTTDDNRGTFSAGAGNRRREIQGSFCGSSRRPGSGRGILSDSSRQTSRGGFSRL